MSPAEHDLDWPDLEDEIVCHEQPKSAIYLNRNDHVVIAQQGDSFYGLGDLFVRFDRMHLPAVIARLSEYLAESVTETSPRNGGEHDVRPAALRQRRYRQRHRSNASDVGAE